MTKGLTRRRIVHQFARGLPWLFQLALIFS